MTLLEQFRRLSDGLPIDWGQARFVLRVDADTTDRAAALLGPLNPGRSGDSIVFTGARAGGPSSLDAIERLLKRLDGERIGGDLELLETHVIEEMPEEEFPASGQLATAWDGALATLPPDWSDLYAEVQLTSSDHLDPGALFLGPLNPSRVRERLAFRFRCARSFGYGVSPSMARRCFERCDDAGIPGSVTVLRALSDTHPVSTQGPVWYVGGKAV